ncbi:unnamed protein product, partial [Rotaria socialis]
MVKKRKDDSTDCRTISLTFALGDKLRVIAKKIPGQTQTIISKLVCGIYQETLIINLSNSSKTNTPLVEGQCVMINIGTELPDTRR